MALRKDIKNVYRVDRHNHCQYFWKLLATWFHLLLNCLLMDIMIAYLIAKLDRLDVLDKRRHIYQICMIYDKEYDFWHLDIQSDIQSELFD